MLFAVLYEYKNDPALISSVRPEHRQYLQKLLEQGSLMASGPLLDDSGALIIYQADNEPAVQQLIKNDPFHQHGIFRQWQIKPWKIVFGNRQLLPDGNS
ncbi:MAG: hypothetical protein JNJ77_01910 [Planctomycetia bacterium]|nr:hypothetical protein [Planctomycetia bacterium]